MKRSDRNAPRDGRQPSQRQLRVGELLRHALIAALARGEVRDPALQGVSVTVTEVRLGPDLRSATAYVMPLGGVGTAEVVEALQRAAPFLRGVIARSVRLRSVPTLSFAADTTFDHAAKIDALLRGTGADSDPAPDAAIAGRDEGRDGR